MVLSFMAARTPLAISLDVFGICLCQNVCCDFLDPGKLSLGIVSARSTAVMHEPCSAVLSRCHCRCIRAVSASSAAVTAACIRAVSARRPHLLLPLASEPSQPSPQPLLLPLASEPSQPSLSRRYCRMHPSRLSLRSAAVTAACIRASSDNAASATAAASGPPQPLPPLLLQPLHIRAASAVAQHPLPQSNASRLSCLRMPQPQPSEPSSAAAAVAFPRSFPGPPKPQQREPSSAAIRAPSSAIRLHAALPQSTDAATSASSAVSFRSHLSG